MGYRYPDYPVQQGAGARRRGGRILPVYTPFDKFSRASLCISPVFNQVIDHRRLGKG
jgi:hypothetical protein